jgi:hypothetical protein
MFIVICLFGALCLFLIHALLDSERRRTDAEVEVDAMLDELLRLRVQLAGSVPHAEYERWRNRAMALMEQFAPAHYAMARARDAQLAHVERGRS